MKPNRYVLSLVPAFIVLLALAAFPRIAAAQVTNWVAYNDHRPSATPIGGWVTAPNVTGYDMGAPADLTASPLTDFLTGNPLTATVAFTRTGTPDDFGALGAGVRTNTPMAQIFFKICNLQNDGVIGVRTTNSVPANATESYVTIQFGGLDLTKRYVFRGAGVRNGGYATRWSVASIAAGEWTDAHINGAGGPGVLTGISFPASALGAGQAAWNSGGNNEGAVVGWNDIVPFGDGTFTITVQQYTGNIPGGTATGSAQYGYSFGALMLAEVEVVAPTITANPAASTNVEQNRPFSLSVGATGAPLNYQWYKGTAEIPGATFPTYSVAQAQLSDSDMYYAVVYNSLARRTSTVAQVTVFADTTAPTVETAFSYPTVDFAGVATLNQIIIEFNESVTAASVGSPASYTVPGGGNPVSVVVTNERSVVLMLATPLAENTDYSVTLSGATDPAGNTAGSSTAPFHSWVSGPGNGLLMESYNVEDTAVTPESVLADPDFPDNPFRADTIRAFDSRLVFADDAQEAYGARIRGVFIPPVSGDWRFFARMQQLGVVNLNPNGISETGKVEIIRQSTENAPYNWDRLQSSLVSLRAGRAYYIEGVYKNVTGPDYLKVAARLAGTDVPMPVDSLNTDAPDTNSMAGAIIAYPLAPKDLGGPLTIVQDLLDVTVEENNPIPWTFAVSNPSGAALHYRWIRDGVQVSTAPNYNFRPSIATDNGAKFRVEVSKVGSAVTSREMTLTVVADVTPPRVLQVNTFATNLAIIQVVFNEPVIRSDAEDFAFNYVVPGFITTAASLAADDRTATVTLDNPMTLSSTYQITIQNIGDLASNPMITTNFTFIAGGGGGPGPELQISLSNGQATISWPAPSTGFILHGADAIVTPVSAINWQPVATPPTVVNGRNTVTVSAASGNRIFRLIQ